MNNIHGILIVIGAMAAFALEDMFLKTLSGHIPIGQIMMMLGALCSPVFALSAIVGGHSLFLRNAWRPIPVIRALSEAAAALLFITALSRVELSVIAAVFQATPLAITTGAALFMGERVGWRRWSSVLVGFMGVLVIVRPGFEGFAPDLLFVVATVIVVALRDLITRLIPRDVSSAVIASQAYFSLIPAGFLMLFFSSETLAPLQADLSLRFLGAAAFGVAGYYGIVAAMRMGDASAVAPFRYTRLLFSMLIGVLVFGERPDAPTLFGATLIIGSGLYVFMRERRVGAATVGGPRRYR